MTAPRIPGYQYVEHLGSGGFADVFLYEQEWPRQRVAIKVVRPDVPLTEREKRLVASEANAMAKLADHPYIVTVMTAGTTEDGRPYLVMRYCPPPDLGVRVRNNPMPVAEAISTGIKLASAIETAHRSGILHRDIKPSNVLITTYAEPALTDFGIAAPAHEVDRDQEIRISYPWSPPEMLDGRSNGSVASDIYSLGATIWHLLVGRSPFHIPGGDNSTSALSARILHAAAPATQRSDVPPALDRLLQQCLAKRPAHRPESALELARGLQRIETAAGFNRTAIAVERGLAEPAPGSAPHADDDATRLKSATMSGSAPRPAAPDGDAPLPHERTPVGVLTWAVLGAVVLAALGTLLFVAAGRGRDPDPGASTTPTASVTPDPVVPGALDGTPLLTGRRTDRGVRFAWSWPDGTRADDTWWWARTDTGEEGRTSGRTMLLDTPDHVCLQIQLIRGPYSSAPADQCVD